MSHHLVFCDRSILQLRRIVDRSYQPLVKHFPTYAMRSGRNQAGERRSNCYDYRLTLARCAIMFVDAASVCWSDAKKNTVGFCVDGVDQGLTVASA